MLSQSLILAIAIIAALAVYYLFISGGLSSSAGAPIVPVKSSYDGRIYYVQDKADKVEAAYRLSQIRERMMLMLECVKKSNGAIDGLPKDDEQRFGAYSARVARLNQRFNPDKIAEGNEDIKYTTYTLNKGEKVVFCLRARGEDDRVHDLQMMTFVAIHEMAHIASVTEHHTPEFNSNFKWLLKHAVKCGIYQPENFRQSPRRYCGIDVTESPLF
jgi:hypothetical protein